MFAGGYQRTAFSKSALNNSWSIGYQPPPFWSPLEVAQQHSSSPNPELVQSHLVVPEHPLTAPTGSHFSRIPDAPVQLPIANCVTGVGTGAP